MSERKKKYKQNAKSTLLSHRPASDDYINDCTAVSSPHMSLCKQRLAKIIALQEKKERKKHLLNLIYMKPQISKKNPSVAAQDAPFCFLCLSP